MIEFERKTVERSLRSYDDYVADVRDAVSQTWIGHLHRLLNFIQTDDVMRVVADELAEGAADAPRWYQATMDTAGSVSGSGTVTLPDAANERLALRFGILQMIVDEEFDGREFCFWMFGVKNENERVRVLNREFVLPFARDLGHKLRDVLDDTSDTEVIPATLIQQNFHAPVTHISRIQGSVIATGGASIVESRITINSLDDLKAQLSALHHLATDVPGDRRREVEKSIDVLVEGADGNVPEDEIKQAVVVVAESSTTLAGGLRQVIAGAGANMLTNVVMAVIQNFMNSF